MFALITVEMMVCCRYTISKTVEKKKPIWRTKIFAKKHVSSKQINRLSRGPGSFGGAWQSHIPGTSWKVPGIDKYQDILVQNWRFCSNRSMLRMNIYERIVHHSTYILSIEVQGSPYGICFVLYTSMIMDYSNCNTAIVCVYTPFTSPVWIYLFIYIEKFEKWKKPKNQEKQET